MHLCPRLRKAIFDDLSIAKTNLHVCIKLFKSFVEKGLKNVVLCPGSRSAPLALAAGGLAESKDINLITSIDERSAAFFALGLSKASSNAVAVITTSGTAVAELLPAAVEADRSCIPLIFLTADRPKRLKDCGANQTVNQEIFLNPVCRFVGQTPTEGFHTISDEEIKNIVNKIWAEFNYYPGPIHLNIPFEEPLYPSLYEQKYAWEKVQNEEKKKFLEIKKIEDINNKDLPLNFKNIDLEKPGILILGPWRGHDDDINFYNEIVRKLQDLSGWPIFADPLSQVEVDQPGLIYNWEILLSTDFFKNLRNINILRLGPLSSSRKLEHWLSNIEGDQLLITEKDFRSLDPLKKSSQYNEGIKSWWLNYKCDKQNFIINNFTKLFLKKCLKLDNFAEEWLDNKLTLSGIITEPSLARWVPKLLSKDVNIMISASSPIRDFLTFGGKSALYHRCFSFRGASGIDGTLSMAMGLAYKYKNTFLITGDLALFHDTNGWLFSVTNNIHLKIILIDNGGGGIFNQFNDDELYKGDFEKLFIMPQNINIISMLEAYDVAFKQVSCLEDLDEAIQWSLNLSKSTVIRVKTFSCEDVKYRNNIVNEMAKHINLYVSSN